MLLMISLAVQVYFVQNCFIQKENVVHVNRSPHVLYRLGTEALFRLDCEIIDMPCLEVLNVLSLQWLVGSSVT